MSMFICPNCGGSFSIDGHTYRCENGHCFDIASEGYVNLLCANAKNSKDPGDDKAMANARFSFLSRGYYEPLREELCALAVRMTGNSPVFLDAGCGEGYYTDGIKNALTAAGKTPSVFGIDISKHILKKAAKRGGGEYAVASVYHMPVKDSSVDMILNCFSPLAISEFHRVLKKDSIFMYVVPGEKHLWEMKQVLYENPYLNEEKLTPYEGFEYITVSRVEYTADIASPEDIRALFGMTPYFWKTPKEGCDRLYSLQELSTTISFNIHVFKKI